MNSHSWIIRSYRAKLFEALTLIHSESRLSFGILKDSSVRKENAAFGSRRRRFLFEFLLCFLGRRKSQIPNRSVGRRFENSANLDFVATGWLRFIQLD